MSYRGNLRPLTPSPFKLRYKKGRVFKTVGFLFKCDIKREGFKGWNPALLDFEDRRFPLLFYSYHFRQVPRKIRVMSQFNRQIITYHL
jgi:hypothetical protein